MGKKDAEAEAEAMVLKFMLKQNRPFNAQTVVDGLKSVVKKTAAAKALEALADRGPLTLKEYGKQKVYFPNQDQFEVPDAAVLKELDDEVVQLTREVADLTEQVGAVDRANKDLDNELTDEQVDAEVAKLEEAIQAGEGKLERLRTGAKPLSAEERASVDKNLGVAQTAWRKRKRICMDAVSQISEGTGKKPKLLVDEMGIEVDEEVGVKPGDGPYQRYLQEQQQRA